MYSDEMLDALLEIYKEAVNDKPELAEQILSVMSEIGVIDFGGSRGTIVVEEDGGPGSGNHGHAGRPGERGGSAPSGSGGGSSKAGKAGGGSGSTGTTYTKAFKSNTGVKFPKLKEGAVWDEDTLNEVNRLARENGKNEQYDEVLKSLKPEDVRYQTDPDGTEVGFIPGLSQMFDTEVVGRSEAIQAAYNARIEAGKKIVDDMIEVSDSLGSRMSGLENCFKAGESTAGKIDRVKAKALATEGKQLTDEQAFARMDDVVRFTFKSDHDKMADQVRSLEKSLEGKGYTILERDNKFLPKQDGSQRNYKAVHLQVLSPSGEKCEVQVHSEETVKVKNKNHSAFEAQRKMSRSNPSETAEWDRLEQQMVDNWSGLKDPVGIQELPSFKIT